MGALYVVATPIGNLQDITRRALDILTSVDLILAEDTRVTQTILNFYHIHNRLESYHKFSEAAKLSQVIDELKAGRSMALVSSAGTPCVSDPGSRLVHEASLAGIPVVPIPGASALTTALSVLGFDYSGVYFLGFLPRKQSEINALFCENQFPEKTVMMFYESPNRLIKTIEFLKQILEDDDIVIFRELTKVYEEIIRGKLHSFDPSSIQTLKGEIVVAILLNESRRREKKSTNAMISSILERLDAGEPIKPLSEELASALNISKRMTYQLLLRR